MIQDAKKQEKFDQSKPQAMDWIKSQARKTFSKKNLYKKVPVLEWLPKYNVETGLFTFFCCCKQTNKQEKELLNFTGLFFQRQKTLEVEE